MVLQIYPCLLDYAASRKRFDSLTDSLRLLGRAGRPTSIHTIAASNGSLAPNITDHHGLGVTAPDVPSASHESHGKHRADDDPPGLHHRPTPRRLSRVSDYIIETALQPQEPWSPGTRRHDTTGISLVVRTPRPLAGTLIRIQRAMSPTLVVDGDERIEAVAHRRADRRSTMRCLSPSCLTNRRDRPGGSGQ